MGGCPVPRMDILRQSLVTGRNLVSETHHGHRIQLLQGSHRLQHQHNKSSALDRFNRSRQKIRSDCLEVLKQHTCHRCFPKSYPSPCSTFRNKVVRSRRCRLFGDARISNVRHCDKYFEWILLVDFTNTTLDIPLDLPLPVSCDCWMLSAPPSCFKFIANTIHTS